ncbi:MAG: hypothetical protein M3R51_00035 [Candidatus Eremiobacteraeota bacterium]|nr:hypothetical protein [Candidatus Eremiobacteraeota bacterium]
MTNDVNNDDADDEPPIDETDNGPQPVTTVRPPDLQRDARVAGENKGGER